MRKLIEGIHRFQTECFGAQRELFERLAKGQAPEVLLITCSDSRIDPCLITQSQPGELFILRNAGNLVPPYQAGGGEAATIEFAVAGLGVKDIIILGHSQCGAMKGLLQPPPSSKFPALCEWLSSYAEATRRIVVEKYSGHSQEDLLNLAIQENVLVQLENLRTHPVVAASLAQGKLELHGWIYKIETGEIFGYDPAASQFLPLTAAHPLSPLPTLTLRAI